MGFSIVIAGYYGSSRFLWTLNIDEGIYCSVVVNVITRCEERFLLQTGKRRYNNEPISDKRNKLEFIRPF